MAQTVLNRTTKAHTGPGKVQLTISKNGVEVEVWEIKLGADPGVAFEISRHVPDLDNFFIQGAGPWKVKDAWTTKAALIEIEPWLIKRLAKRRSDFVVRSLMTNRGWA